MEKKLDIKTIADIRREFAPIVNTNEVVRNRLSHADKIAFAITKRVGTMTFFYFCAVFVTIPLFFAPALPWVQYLSSGYIQLLLLPLIMIGQNLQSRHAELRAQHDYETNVKAEKEIEAILLHLERQDATMQEILKKIEGVEKSKYFDTHGV